MRLQIPPIVLGPFDFIVSDNSQLHAATYRLLRPFSSATQWQFSLPALTSAYTITRIHALNVTITNFWATFPPRASNKYILLEFSRFTKAIETANRVGLDQVLECAALISARVEVSRCFSLYLSLRDANTILILCFQDFDITESCASVDSISSG